tara:strand:+ start:16879 stop:18066 length:1188 start_codon:yes stop_codon:yes gene_type:complete
MKKTIAFFWENYEFGGVSTNLASLINSRSFKKNKIIVFTNESNKAIKRFKILVKNKDFKIVTFKNYLDLRFNNKLYKLFLLLLRPIVFFLTLFEIFFILKKYKIDIFISECGGYGDFRSDLGSLIIAKLLKFPTRAVIFHHSYTRPKFWVLISNLLNSWIINFSNKFIFVSNATFQNISQKIFFFNLKKRKIKIIDNGIEINKKKKNYKISKIIKSKSLNGIVLSRIQEDKGHEDLVKAFILLPKKIRNKINLYFVGEGEKKYVLYLKDLIKSNKLNKNIHFVGYVKGTGRDIIRYFDFLVSPSRYFEGFGLSILESLSVGTPVISTRVGGVTGFLNKNNSILVKPFQIKEISNAIIQIYEKQKHLMNKKVNGIRLVKSKLTSEIMGEKYLNFLN